MSNLVIRQGFKFRLRPSAKQAALMRQFAGCRRKVWNLALDEQKKRHERGEPYANYVAMAKWLTAWRNSEELAYLKSAPVHALQSTLRDLDAAYQCFFKSKGGFPSFQRKGQNDDFRETDVACFEVDEANSRIKLPKLGWMRYRQSRLLSGQPKNVAVSHDALGWHVSIQTEREANNVLPESTRMGAADRGVTNFLALDSGELVEPLNAHKTALHRLRRYQRTCARKVEALKRELGITGAIPKGTKLPVSNRLMRSRQKLARYSAKIARMRQDWLHKLSTRLADEHALFVLEDLRTKNMTKRAKGTTEAPGTNVKQKTSLNRSILDQGWAMFATQLQYKLVHRGGQLLLINPRNTSRTCSACGYTDALNRHGEKFSCLACGQTDHADVNAAKNILAAGHAVLAGVTSGQADVEDTVQQDRPTKRQPALEVEHVVRS
jgi:putative transposase